MYTKLYIASLVIASALAIPQRYQTPIRTAISNGGSDASASILAQNQVINGDGSYAYNYETSNGIRASERSQDGLTATGEFSFVAPEGAELRLTYVADENGFQPEGSHLPVEPPAPAHVIRALKALRASNNRDLDLASLDETIARLIATQG
ncbi:endocuticle structural glycoprotein ABD-4-like [Toxorhynchites rutilus septentrionalis]|uniref:endocuticle structural glycoprotein ABD-4-like n=1 Tax=Toxorhynchites rutilus septentrionalis TaxID=329112 RepID=UPI0024784C68|nr:endocuticle structural glycoprotein ABD-4-like [Toxorhynchites rutilus septentrionalis]